MTPIAALVSGKWAAIACSLPWSLPRAHLTHVGLKSPFGLAAGMLKCSGQEKEVNQEGFVKWSKQFPAVAQALRAPFARLAQSSTTSQPSASHATVVGR